MEIVDLKGKKVDINSNRKLASAFTKARKRGYASQRFSLTVKDGILDGIKKIKVNEKGFAQAVLEESGLYREYKIKQ